MAEGLPVAADYLLPIEQMPRYQQRAVFGRSGYPWTCPLYQGDPDQSYPTPNAIAVHDTLFRLPIHENMTDVEVRDTLAALKKVEQTYLH